MKKVWIVALTAVLAVGCSKEQGGTEPGGGEKGGLAVLSLSARAAGTFVSAGVKADGLPLGEGTSVGVFVTKKGAGLPAVEVSVDEVPVPYGNFKYTADASGKITGNPILLETGNEYDVYGYSPHKQGVLPTDSKVPVAHGEDLLWAKETTASLPMDGGSAVLKLKHACAQVRFVVAHGSGDWTGAPDLATATVQVGGFYDEGVLDLNTGALAKGATAAQTIAEKDTPVCIVTDNREMTLPVKVVYNGKTYENAFTGIFESGVSYKCTIRLDDLGSGLTVDRPAVTDWTYMGNQDVGIPEETAPGN